MADKAAKVASIGKKCTMHFLFIYNGIYAKSNFISGFKKLTAKRNGNNAMGIAPTMGFEGRNTSFLVAGSQKKMKLLFQVKLSCQLWGCDCSFFVGFAAQPGKMFSSIFNLNKEILSKVVWSFCPASSLSISQHIPWSFCGGVGLLLLPLTSSSIAVCQQVVATNYCGFCCWR